MSSCGGGRRGRSSPQIWGLQGQGLASSLGVLGRGWSHLWPRLRVPRGNWAPQFATIAAGLPQAFVRASQGFAQGGKLRHGAVGVMPGGVQLGLGGNHAGRIPVGSAQHGAALQGHPGERSSASDPAAEPAGECSHLVPWPSSTLLCLSPSSSTSLSPSRPQSRRHTASSSSTTWRAARSEGTRGTPASTNRHRRGGANPSLCPRGPEGMGRDWDRGPAAAGKLPTMADSWMMGTEQDGCQGDAPHFGAPSGSPSPQPALLPKLPVPFPAPPG